MDYAGIVRHILADYPLTIRGIHGVAHWARVWDTGLLLADSNGADVEVVKLFALFHDSRRENDWDDPDHGRRGAEFATELRGRLFDLDDQTFARLHHACEWHTARVSDPDPTVQACWDADRLDLGRVGIEPSLQYLQTPGGRNPEVIRWAHDRSVNDHEPSFVSTLWGVPPGR